MTRQWAKSVRRAVVLTTSVALLVGPALPASAASSPLPKTKFDVTSIQWHHRTGTVAVTADVKCAGEGTFSWQTSLQQRHARARGSANVPCDGDRFLSTIILDAKQGRFHPGSAEFSKGTVTCATDVCIGLGIGRLIRISPR